MKQAQIWKDVNLQSSKNDVAEILQLHRKTAQQGTTS